MRVAMATRNVTAKSNESLPTYLTRHTGYDLRLGPQAGPRGRTPGRCSTPPAVPPPTAPLQVFTDRRQ
jgi:hypothetical protein